MHRYDIWFGTDGDYVVLNKFEDGAWVECTRWLIPGSHLHTWMDA